MRYLLAAIFAGASTEMHATRLLPDVQTNITLTVTNPAGKTFTTNAPNLIFAAEAPQGEQIIAWIGLKGSYSASAQHRSNSLIDWTGFDNSAGENLNCILHLIERNNQQRIWLVNLSYMHRDEFKPNIRIS